MLGSFYNANFQVYDTIHIEPKIKGSDGKSISVSCENNLHFKKIPEFWNECQRNGIFAKLRRIFAHRQGGFSTA